LQWAGNGDFISTGGNNTYPAICENRPYKNILSNNHTLCTIVVLDVSEGSATCIAYHPLHNE